MEDREKSPNKDRNEEMARKYLNDEMSLRQLADHYSLSPERVRQILDRMEVERRPANIKSK